MVGFLKKSMNTKVRVFAVLAILFFAGITSHHILNRAQAASTDPLPVDLVTGDVSGFAWMGTEIANVGESEGGGGWLNFNCKTTYCYDLNSNGNVEASEKWGVTLDLDHAGVDGSFQGQAWSSNYGWLTFRGNQVSSCWLDHPGVTYDGVARADIASGSGIVDVTGWAKFTAGGDDNTWDGCVAFSGATHRVKLDMSTGKLTGWAWGGPVVGWISFQNPECRYCNPSIALEGVPQMTFWVNPMTLLPGMTSANIKWTSSTVNGNYVASCSQYGNDQGWNHWDSSLPHVPPNVVDISTTAGNLPFGLHPATGITETTTYNITCVDNLGNTLPTKYATVTVWTEGCMDPLASNYDAEADIDDGSCVFGLASTVNLYVDTFGPNYGLQNAQMPAYNNNPIAYQAGPHWNFSDPSMVAANSCHGTFFDQAGNPLTAPGSWSSSALAGPPQTAPLPGGTYATTTNIATFADNVPGGTYFTFTITCADIYGNPITDSAIVTIIDVPSDPVPSLALFAENPTLIIGSGNYSEKLWWTSNNPSALDACVGDFSRIAPSAQNPNLSSWESVPLPDPNMNQNPGYTAHQGGFNNIANTVTVDGTTYRFTITCNDTLHPGSDVSASANVQFIFEPTPCCEPPLLDLIIKIPDSDNAGHTEQIPVAGWDNSVHTGDPFTLKWTALNVQNCHARSEQFVGPGGSVTTNGNWDGQSIPDDGDPSDSSMVERSFSILAPLDTKNTIFYLDCIPDDPGFGTGIMTAQVCMSITGQLFPQCTVPGPARIPSYIEI